jgi:phosphoenolpyruvate synthase/pyruvate phosphate dikinase
MKSVYYFGKNNSDSQADMKNLLGEKGANLAEMAKQGIPMPAGLTITTDAWTFYYNNDQKELKTGICGEHGGDPSSVELCYNEGLDYVSCSPSRVSIARFAAAQSVLK